MKEFSFLDYHTVYSCKGDLKEELSPKACFGYVFREVKDTSKVTYQVIIYLGTDYSKNTHKSNACLFSKKEVYNHLRLLKSLYPINISVKNYTRDGDYERLLVTLHIEKVPGAFHKYALTWLRYTYEFPYNVLLKDAYELKKDPMFKFESIANLFNLTIGCYCQEPMEIHQIPVNGISTRMKIVELREKIKQIERLNAIYFTLRQKYKCIPKIISGYNVNDAEYWTEEFEIRKPIYLDVYKEIKK